MELPLPEAISHGQRQLNSKVLQEQIGILSHFGSLDHLQYSTSVSVPTL